MADVDEQHVAADAAGYESVGARDAFTKVTELNESGVIERLNLAKCEMRGAAREKHDGHKY